MIQSAVEAADNSGQPLPTVWNVVDPMASALNEFILKNLYIPGGSRKSDEE